MPFIVGISGGQGSGKSYISSKIQNDFGDDCAVLSLDDFYLTHAQRQALAKSISPMLETRGPPGTHDVGLLIEIVNQLQNPLSSYPIEYPKFDKLTDDRCDAPNVIHTKPKIIIIEGWCIGAVPGDDFVTSPPINAVEQGDSDAKWRAYQYHALNQDYKKLWAMIDQFYYLIAPSFGIITQWKSEQLARDKGIAPSALPQKDRKWVNNFIQYYERITRGIMDKERVEGLEIRLNNNRMVE